MKDGAVQLGNIAGKITMLEIACRRCERRGAASSLTAETTTAAAVPSSGPVWARPLHCRR
jgi:hypothetical protein